jgi:hypothetical protein
MDVGGSAVMFREALAAAGSMAALADRLSGPEPEPSGSGGTHWWPDDLIDRLIEETLTAAL